MCSSLPEAVVEYSIRTEKTCLEKNCGYGPPFWLPSTGPLTWVHGRTRTTPHVNMANPRRDKRSAERLRFKAVRVAAVLLLLSGPCRGLKFPVRLRRIGPPHQQQPASRGWMGRRNAAGERGGVLWGSGCHAESAEECCLSRSKAASDRQEPCTRYPSRHTTPVEVFSFFFAHRKNPWMDALS